MKSAPNFQRFLAVGYAVIFALVAASQSQAAAADKRIALVLGNSAYQNTEPLPSPKNDAEDMAARLTSLGFQVILGQDLERSGMDAKIAEFAEALAGSETDVAVFFYAGHGLQVGGQNYLVPVDAKLASGSSPDFEAVRLDLVQRAMESAAKTRIIFLDACRDNPLARSLARSMGLAAVKAELGTLVSFSTQPGNVALDGEGRNSPYSAALVRHLGDSASLSDVLIKVRHDVIAATQQKQVPWEHSALRARFYFKSPSRFEMGGKCAPILGPYGAHENPWCKEHKVDEARKHAEEAQRKAKVRNCSRQSNPQRQIECLQDLIIDMQTDLAALKADREDLREIIDQRIEEALKPRLHQ